MNNNSLNLQGQLRLMGARGYSAYEVAKLNGFVGTEEEWLASLVGPQGPEGPEGKSAYEVAVENGYVGTVEEWLAAFLTPDGYYTKGEIDQRYGAVKYIFPKSHTHSGDYNIIQVDNKNILIDCYSYDDWAEFKAVLDSYNISHLDIFICTHFHADHIGNFKNLVDLGYIDQTTTLYFPTYDVETWVEDSSYVSPHTYLEAMDTVETYNLEPINPTEGMEVNINNYTKLIFYNTDDVAARQRFTQISYYNNASLIVFVKHYDITSIYWGDCYNQPVQWLDSLGLIPENIGIWKMGHHGIDYSGQSAFNVLRKLKINYAIEELGRNYLYRGHGYANGTASDMQKLGVPVFVSAYNEDNIEIITRLNLINLLVGTDTLTAEKSRYKTISFYVDPVNYKESKQDGTSTYPFSNLNQCLGNIDRNNGVSYTINLANGDYNKEFTSYDEAKDISTLYGMTNKVTIKGNSSDKTAVVLHHGFNIQNCTNIVVQDLTIFNGGTKSGFTINNSTVEISNIKYYVDTDRTDSKPVGISTENSTLYVSNSIFSITNHAIKAVNCNLYLNDISADNLVYQCLNVSNCIVKAKNCAVTDDSQKLVTYENDKSSFVNGISLWSGSLSYDSVEPDNNVITINSRVDRFTNIQINYILDDTQNKYCFIMPALARICDARIDNFHMNDTYCWFNEGRLEFNDYTATLTMSKKRRMTLADSSITAEAVANITIVEILGL